MQKFISNFIVLIVTCLVTPVHAHACASCGFNDDSSPFFLLMIVFMTSLPVIFVGSVVYYLKKQRDKNIEKNELLK
jgi:hypothetical protein